MLWPCTHPSCCRPSWNAVNQAFVSRSRSANIVNTPMRRIRSPCCARAASGQTATLLPRSAMNSRRLMGAYPKAKDHEPIIARCVAQKACSRSFRLDARELDHLGPLLGFVGNEFTEIGGRE